MVKDRQQPLSLAVLSIRIWLVSKVSKLNTEESTDIPSNGSAVKILHDHTSSGMAVTNTNTFKEAPKNQKHSFTLLRRARDQKPRHALYPCPRFCPSAPA